MEVAVRVLRVDSNHEGCCLADLMHPLCEPVWKDLSTQAVLLLLIEGCNCAALMASHAALRLEN